MGPHGLWGPSVGGALALHRYPRDSHHEVPKIAVELDAVRCRALAHARGGIALKRRWGKRQGRGSHMGLQAGWLGDERMRRGREAGA